MASAPTRSGAGGVSPGVLSLSVAAGGRAVRTDRCRAVCGGSGVDAVGLSLTREHRRGHGALYDGLNAGRIQVDRLRRGVGGLPLPRDRDGRLVLAVDVSPWLRPEALRQRSGATPRRPPAVSRDGSDDLAPPKSGGCWRRRLSMCTQRCGVPDVGPERAGRGIDLFCEATPGQSVRVPAERSAYLYVEAGVVERALSCA